jgi:hypothetical protein
VLHRFAEWAARKLDDLPDGGALFGLFAVWVVFIWAAAAGAFGGSRVLNAVLLFLLPLLLVSVLQKVLEWLRDPYMPHQREHVRLVHEGDIVTGTIAEFKLDIFPNTLHERHHTMLDDYHTLYAQLTMWYAFTPPGRAYRKGYYVRKLEEHKLVFGTESYWAKERELRAKYQPYVDANPPGTPLYVLYLEGIWSELI